MSSIAARRVNTRVGPLQPNGILSRGTQAYPGANGTADPAQRDALAQQVLNQRALLVRNNVVFGAGHKLASTRFALMILFAGARMAIFLVLVRLTLWAGISHNHSWLLTSAVLVTTFGQQ